MVRIVRCIPIQDRAPLRGVTISYDHTSITTPLLLTPTISESILPQLPQPDEAQHTTTGDEVHQDQDYERRPDLLLAHLSTQWYFEEDNRRTRRDIVLPDNYNTLHPDGKGP